MTLMMPYALFLDVLFSYEMSLMGTGTELSQFLRVRLPTLIFISRFVNIFKGLQNY